MGAEYRYREGTTADLEATFALAERVRTATEVRNELVPESEPLSEADRRVHWLRRRPLLELLAAQADGRYWICEHDGEPIGYARVVRFEGYEELTELEVDPEHQARGIGKALLGRCWPDDPSPEMARVLVAPDVPAALSLYMDFGVMPAAGHWRMSQSAEEYAHERSPELADADPVSVSALEVERAISEWKRLEPAALGHQRPALHEFFGRDRACLASVDETAGQATGLCWVSADGEIGPAVGARPEDLVPVVLAALDRVARVGRVGELTVYTTSLSWWLVRRLRALGFRVELPGWVMSSEPIPGLDRYLPTRPPQLL